MNVKRTSLTDDGVDTHSVWIGKGEDMKRVSDNVANVVCFVHEAGDKAEDWKMMTIKETSNVAMISLLLAMYDFCSMRGLAPPRAWAPIAVGSMPPGQPLPKPMHVEQRSVIMPPTDITPE